MSDERTEERPGRRHTLAKNAGAVLFVIAIGRIAFRLAGVDTPDVPLPDIPLPGRPDLPGWVRPVVNWGTLAVVVMAVLLLARAALHRRRARS